MAQVGWQLREQVSVGFLSLGQAFVAWFISVSGCQGLVHPGVRVV